MFFENTEILNSEILNFEILNSEILNSEILNSEILNSEFLNSEILNFELFRWCAGTLTFLTTYIYILTLNELYIVFDVCTL